MLLMNDKCVKLTLIDLISLMNETNNDLDYSSSIDKTKGITDELITAYENGEQLEYSTGGYTTLVTPTSSISQKPSFFRLGFGLDCLTSNRKYQSLFIDGSVIQDTYLIEFFQALYEKYGDEYCCEVDLDYYRSLYDKFANVQDNNRIMLLLQPSVRKFYQHFFGIYRRVSKYYYDVYTNLDTSKFLTEKDKKSTNEIRYNDTPQTDGNNYNDYPYNTTITSSKSSIQDKTDFDNYKDYYNLKAFILDAWCNKFSELFIDGGNLNEY